MSFGEHIGRFAHFDRALVHLPASFPNLVTPRRRQIFPGRSIEALNGARRNECAHIRGESKSLCNDFFGSRTHSGTNKT